LDDVWHIRIMQMRFVILSQLNEYDDDDIHICNAKTANTVQYVVPSVQSL